MAPMHTTSPTKLFSTLQDLKATMVVMANHNKGAVAEFFMGSVSQYVMHHCLKPVLVTRGI